MADAVTPLWRQLQAAASVVEAVRAGQSATQAIAAVANTLRPAAQALSFQALRHLGRAQALRARLAKRPPPPAADALLCTAVALVWDPAHAPYAPFTLVDQAVEAAKRHAATRPQSNFINACLRRFLRERDQLVADTDADPVARWNHPRWWIERLRKDHPQHWQAILERANEQPPMTLRVNARRVTADDYLLRLRQAGLDGMRTGDYGIVLASPRPVHELPGFDEGVVSVQDAAAQIAAPLLLRELQPPEDRPLRILDACAAPGGKTAHLLELADAELLALDVAPERCERIRETLRRLGLHAQVLAADAAEPAAWWDGRAFDAILLDAPCTGSGIVRRHPDVRWLRRPTDVDQLAAQQARLLESLWPLLRASGRLVYCTCSVFRAEGQDQMAAFLARHPDAQARPAPGHLLPRSGGTDNGVGDNAQSDHDGFYYALLEKTGTTGA